ncbi:Tetraacyldisaccharide 4'-kinase [Gammaproteobacteria bacterium]
MPKTHPTLGERLMARWYQPTPIRPLLPLAWLFGAGVRLRRQLYQSAWWPSHRLPVPVVVVGNLTVGGTGKTPLTLWLARYLSSQGWRVGLLTRGYRGQSRDWPQWVTPLSDPREVGDEALLLAASGCPLVAGPDRVAGGHWLVTKGCNLVLSDDGLQHYRLARDREILVVDGERGFGNRCLLPAGPLREPVARQAEVSLVVTQGVDLEDRPAFRLVLGDPVRVDDPSQSRPLAAFPGSTVTAVAGIGHPQRFFRQLQAAGLSLTCHAFPDHHPYERADFATLAGPILMTGKDAVKCRPFADARFWEVPVHLEPNACLIQAIDTLFAAPLSRHHETGTLGFSR